MTNERKTIAETLTRFEHASSDLFLTFQVDAIRFARCIADHGVGIIDDQIALATAICEREFKERSISIGQVWRVSELDVGDISTWRGMEHVFNWNLVGERGTALVRLSTHEDEFCLYAILGDGTWCQLAENLLTHEVRHPEAGVEVVDQGVTLDVRVIWNDAVLWEVLSVPKDLGSIARAVARFGTDPSDDWRVRR